MCLGRLLKHQNRNIIHIINTVTEGQNEPQYLQIESQIKTENTRKVFLINLGTKLNTSQKAVKNTEHFFSKGFKETEKAVENIPFG